MNKTIQKKREDREPPTSMRFKLNSCGLTTKNNILLKHPLFDLYS